MCNVTVHIIHDESKMYFANHYDSVLKLCQEDLYKDRRLDNDQELVQKLKTTGERVNKL